MVARWEGCWGIGEGVKSTNWQLQNSHRHVKYSIGNIVSNTVITSNIITLYGVRSVLNL